MSRSNLFIFKRGDKLEITYSENGAIDVYNIETISKATITAIQEMENTISEDYIRSTNSTGESCDSSTASLNQGSRVLRELGSTVFFSFMSGDLQERLSSLSGELAISTNEQEIPWELMYNDSDFLCIKYPISRKVHVMRDVPTKTRIIDPDHIKMLFLSNPSDNLPWADKEVDRITSYLKPSHPEVFSTIFRNEQVERKRLIPVLRDFDIIHYAGHAYYNKLEPENSSILLSDGEWRVGEIRNSLSRNPPLMAFMNACQSAKFAEHMDIVQRGNIAGIASAFIMAGTKCFIGTTWPIGDRSASEFASEFYSSLFEGKNVGISLLHARRSSFAKQNMA